ncbi:MAG: DUF1501 domain-containing protein [Verrucomicrobiota bacterium JB022]|nr:DUF1501 domain-containing protein [Verrucomicrobiota bacterium JB022]
MNNAHAICPCTRREFLDAGVKGLGLIAFSQFAPAFLTQAAAAKLPGAEKDRTVLVLIQLAGGNDGLNTLVPYADDHYHRLRPTIGLKPKDVLKLDDHLGLHPSLQPLLALRDQGQLGIIQNVGYPNPNRSHFRSTEIWETASDADETEYTGWLGRYLDNACNGRPESDPEAIHFTDQVPQSYFSQDTHHIFSSRPTGRYGTNQPNRDLLKSVAEAPLDEDNAAYLSQTLMDALVTEEKIERVFRRYKTEVDYPQNQLAQSLKRIAALISAGIETRVYYASLGGFDTHNNQAQQHARLLGELAGAMQAFQQDLDRKGLSDQVLTMTFSEFGRRPSENDSNGTDHGTAAPLFVMGSQIKAPLLGSPADLNLQKNQDLTFSTDFRSVYATVLDRWFQCDQAEAVLGRKFDRLEFI